MIREIIRKDRTLGSIKFSTSSHAKEYDLSEVIVYGDMDFASKQGFQRVIGIRCNKSDDQGGKPAIVTISHNAAMELVKGILQNMAYITIAADEEFCQIVDDARKKASDEAQSIVDAVRRFPRESADFHNKKTKLLPD